MQNQTIIMFINIMFRVMGNGYTRFFPKPIWRVSDVHTIKGALDKYNIYLSISNSIEDFKLNLNQNF